MSRYDWITHKLDKIIISRTNREQANRLDLITYSSRPAAKMTHFLVGAEF